MTDQTIPPHSLQQSLNDVMQVGPTWVAPTPAQVQALEQKLGEALPPGSHSTLPATSGLK